MTNPYLQDEHTLVTGERTDLALTVDGALPEGLSGTFVRNSGNPFFPPSERHHWFDGDGMVHGVHLGEGRADYRNRWIRTEGFLAEQAAGRPLWRGINESPDPASPGGPVKDTANTHLVVWKRQLLATWWLSGRAMSLGVPGLDTVGPAMAGARTLPRMAAHPKVDPRTGELVFFSYDPVRPPYVRYGVANPTTGEVTVQPIELPFAHVPHDIGLTEHYTILMDLPLGWDARAMAQGKRRIGFFRERPARFGILPRHGTAADIRWFEAEPCYVYHLTGAWEEGDEVVVTGCRIADPIPETDPGPRVPRLDSIALDPVAYRWRFDLVTGAVREEALDDVRTEFPRVDDRGWGRPLRYAYHPRLSSRPAMAFDGLVKYDHLAGTSRSIDWDGYSGEVVFAPRPGGTDGDDGWLLGIVSNVREDSSRLMVLDARDLAQVASVRLPWRVPLGFHAEWVPSGAVGAELTRPV